MTSFRPKLWTGVSAAILLGATGLAACGEAGEKAEAPVAATPAPAAGEGGEGGAEGGVAGEAGAQAAYVGVPAESRAALRLAHLRGFFQIAKQQPEGADYAAALAGQGMLEVYDVAADAFKSTGVDEAKLRKAVETGAPADLDAAIAAIDAAMARTGGDALAIAKGMVSISSGLYQNVLHDGAVDPIEYQHSLGAALSARDVLAKSKDPKAAAAKAEIDKFVALWPGPVAPEKPTPAAQVAAQASRVQLALG
jgi:hypothetical protein